MKSKLLCSLIVLSGVMINGVTLADPKGIDVTIGCPVSALNDGSKITGKGSREISGVDFTTVTFRTEGILPKEIPEDLSMYRPMKTTYGSTTGKVTCYYQDKFGKYPEYSLSYILENGKGGVVKDSQNATIRITIPFGR